MKYFICSLDAIFLGVSTELAEGVTSVSRIQTAVCEKEDNTSFISLPALLKRDTFSALHGIVLKRRSGVEKDGKIILLMPPIDIDLEIAEKDIYTVPRVVSGMFRFFSGVCFSDQRLIFTLDTEKLLDVYVGGIY